ncbi:MAG: hypothetical protein HLUCCO17_13970 [Saliniramus fredricksonii]|uniref:Uncharacterized protein n=1 Tax=Saliniramus fredricksonii TaxID=1653334 RepID=A0A0P8A334_9HYPH|nr:hypothetical protein [Saliniramus fredricksonii]KPQ09637.1 MAG: hypothetical protein HLUCCO17_13970 [Saliniramus fredricksonii]SCC78420.1 hypothetical protein GA0071312_0275 [Saliniramus fredricksonii]
MTKAAGPTSLTSPTAGQPLVAQAAAPAGELVGQGVLEALRRLGMEGMAVPLGAGAARLAGGVATLLTELAMAQSTANPDDMAALMRALAEEGVTFDGHIAWETLPDGRRMMVLADDPNVIIAILREDGSLFINPDFLPDGAQAGARPAVTPQTLGNYRFGDTLPATTPGVILTIPDLPGYDRETRAGGGQPTETSAISAAFRDVADFNAGAGPEDRIRVMTLATDPDGAPQLLTIEGTLAQVREEYANLHEAGFFDADTAASQSMGLLTALQLSGVSQELRAILRHAGELEGVPQELRAILRDGSVMPPPMEETREGLLGPDTPSSPDGRRTADAEGFPQTAQGVPPYNNTANREPHTPSFEPERQIPPDPGVFAPGTTFPPVETQPARPAGAVSDASRADGTRTVESVGELQEALREYGIILTDILSNPDLPDEWREIVFPRSEEQVIEMGNALLPLLSRIEEQFPGALRNLKIDVSGSNPADLSERGNNLGLTASDIGLMFLETPTRIQQILSGTSEAHPDMAEHAYAHEIGHALTSVAPAAMQDLKAGLETVIEVGTQFSTHASEDAVTLDVALAFLYPDLSMAEAYERLGRDYIVRPHPGEITDASGIPETWREHPGTLRIMQRPSEAPRDSADEYATFYARTNDNEFAAETLAFFLRGEPVEPRSEVGAPFISTTLGAPLPDFLRERAGDVMGEARGNTGPTSSWAPEWQPDEAQ